MSFNRLLLSSAVFAVAVAITAYLIYPDAAEEKLVALASEGRVEEFASTVAKEGSINAKAFDDRTTPLIAAARERRLPMVLFLVDHGADVNLKNGGGSPLFWAAFGGDREIFQYLLHHGAKFSASTQSIEILKLQLKAKGLDELLRDVEKEIQSENAKSSLSESS